MKKYSVIVIEDFDAESANDAFELFRQMISNPDNTNYDVSVREIEDRKEKHLESFYRDKGSKELKPFIASKNQN